MVYRVRHFSLPLGFDAPWYVWRADFVASQGMGPIETAARPGHALLSANLQSLTGLSALQLDVVLPFVLVGVFALALGVLFAEGLGRGETSGWAIGAAVAAGLIGTTRLVGENVANLLNILLVVVGFLFLLRFITRRRGFVGAVAMLVAAGLAHWVFLGVFALVLGVWFVLALPVSRVRVGTVWETEAGALAAAGAIVGAVMAILIYPVLHSSVRTFDLHEPKHRYIEKFREDLGALRTAFTGPFAALGVGAMAVDRGGALRSGFLRMIGAWTIVTGGGTIVAAATKAIQPHRFLTLLVVGPVVCAIAAAIAFAAGWLRRRVGSAVAVACGLLSVAAAVIPGAVTWYGDSPPKQFWDATAFQQARVAGEYVRRLPAGKPVVFVVNPLGPFGPVSTAEKERTIRAAMPPDRQEDVHVYPGSIERYAAGHPTHVPNEEIDVQNDAYWRDVKPVLRRHPAVLVLSAFAPRGPGLANLIAPGVAVFRGPAHIPVPLLRPVHPVPTTEVALGRAIMLLILLAVAGLGWTAWFLGRARSPLQLFALSPAIGSGVLILASLVTAKSGFALGGVAGKATWAVVALCGAVIVFASDRRQRGEELADR
ncbi:MAG: hypothetical protein ABR600_01100 [Actinomycetota bacterium]